LMQKALVNQISGEILKGELKSGQKVVVDASGDGLIFKHP